MGVKSESKAALWSTRIAAFEASGQRRRTWCAAQGLNVNTFGYWRYRLRDRVATPLADGPRKRPPGAETALVPVMVKPAPAPPTASTLIELEWPSGLRLRATLGANVLELSALVHALCPC